MAEVDRSFVEQLQEATMRSVDLGEAVDEQPAARGQPGRSAAAAADAAFDERFAGERVHRGDRVPRGLVADAVRLRRPGDRAFARDRAQEPEALAAAERLVADRDPDRAVQLEASPGLAPPRRHVASTTAGAAATR